MGGFQEHCLRLFLSKELYIAFIKLQADRSLGRSYAGLLPFVEGLHLMGYLNESQYEAHKKKYSISLNQDPKQVTLEENEKLQESKKLNKLFGQIIDQFDLHKDKPGWVDLWFHKAEKNGEIPNAKKLLALVQESRG